MTTRELLEEYDNMLVSCPEEEVEQWLLDQCGLADSSGPSGILKRSTLYNELGGFYRHHGKLKQAEQAFLKAKELLETPVCTKEEGVSCCYYMADLPDGIFGFRETVPVKTANYATILNNLAGNYRLQKRFQEAEELFRQAIDIYRQEPDLPRALFCSAYNNLALVYLDQGRSPEAVRELAAVQEILEQQPGNEHEKATTCANLAIAQARSGDRESAAASLMKAGAYYRQAGLETSEEYEAFLCLKEKLL